jgi:hypothetical protein
MVPTGKLLPILKTSKNGRLRSIDLEMNLFKEARLPTSLSAPFFDFSDSIRSMASILCGFSSIPYVDTRHPRIFPFFTPNTHFLGFSSKLALRKLAKVS